MVVMGLNILIHPALRILHVDIAFDFDVTPASLGTTQQEMSDSSSVQPLLGGQFFSQHGASASGDAQSFHLSICRMACVAAQPLLQSHKPISSSCFASFSNRVPFPWISPELNRIALVFKRCRARPGSMRPLLSDIAGLQRDQPSRRFLLMTIHGCCCIPNQLAYAKLVLTGCGMCNCALAAFTRI